MDDFFNVAIIVLVVLAQLGGAVIAAWKKRQAERERQAQRGGIVIVDDDRGSSASARNEASSWDLEEDDEPSERASSERRTSYDDLEDLEEEEAEPEQYWKKPFPKETSEAARQPTSNAAAVASTSITELRRAMHSEPSVSSHRQQLTPTAGKHKGPSKARKFLGQGGLRQAILAQTILTPPPASRSLRR